jgi:hypothetical protein
LVVALALAALIQGIWSHTPVLIAAIPFILGVAWPVLRPFAKAILERLCGGQTQRAAMDQQLCAVLAVYAAHHIPPTTKRTLCYAAWRWTPEGLLLDSLSVHGAWLDIDQLVPSPLLPVRPPHPIPIALCARWRVRHKATLFLDWPTAHAQLAVLAELRRRAQTLDTSPTSTWAPVPPAMDRGAT